MNLVGSSMGRLRRVKFTSVIEREVKKVKGEAAAHGKMVQQPRTILQILHSGLESQKQFSYSWEKLLLSMA